MLYTMKQECYKVKMLYSISALLEVKMTRHDKQMNVRMAHETVSELKEVAKKNRRSVTAQLNQIIEDWLKEQKQQSAKA